jgi:hypothetical protein
MVNFRNPFRTLIGNLSRPNVIKRPNLLEEIRSDLSAEIEFTASHFFEISLSDL